jgi:hypothetical protein
VQDEVRLDLVVEEEYVAGAEYPALAVAEVEEASLGHREFDHAVRQK